ncbi:MAG: hypothetical protein V1790_08385 [Planctomycetota bacterium]
MPPGVCVVLLTIGAGVSNSRGQSTSDADAIVSLNEGIYLYLRVDRTDEAIEQFNSVLGRQPTDQTALLFRGLCHGQKALVERREKRDLQGRIAVIGKVLKIRADRQELDRIRDAAERAQRNVEGGAEGEARVADAAAGYFKAMQQFLKQFEGRSEKELGDDLRAAQQEFHRRAAREREHYLTMIADLERVVSTVDDPKAVVRLADVLAKANVARIDDLRARGIEESVIAAETGETPQTLHDTAKRLLADAAAALQALLEVSKDQLSPDDLARTRLFLGVVRYRQGVPPTKPDEPTRPTAADLQMFKEAKRYLSELADDSATPLLWRSYAAFYLGLVLPWIASSDGVAEEERQALLSDARRHLADAVRMDSEYVTEQKEAGRTFPSDVPELVRQQRELIDSLAREQKPRNDVSFTAFFGTRYDTNIILLGERTDLPRDVSRQKDFGLESGWAVDYTHDLTERLAVGVQVRTAQLWNAGVEQFDQQTYGASFAWQYEFLKKEGSMGPGSFTLQYDYDYTLLGKDEFLQNHAVRPGVKLDWADGRATSALFLNYQRRDYSEPLFDRRLDRDGDYFTVGVLHEFKTVEMTQVYKEWGLEPWGLPSDAGLDQDDPDYPHRYLRPHIGARHSWDSTAGDEFDRRANALQAGVQIPLPWGVAFDAAAVLEWENYSHGSLVDFHRRERHDLVQEYAIALSRTFVLREGMRANRYAPTIDRMLMTVRAHATWTDDDSNVLDRPGQAVFSYDRAVYGVSVAFTIN